MKRREVVGAQGVVFGVLLGMEMVPMVLREWIVAAQFAASGSDVGGRLSGGDEAAVTRTNSVDVPQMQIRVKVVTDVLLPKIHVSGKLFVMFSQMPDSREQIRSRSSWSRAVTSSAPGGLATFLIGDLVSATRNRRANGSHGDFVNVV
jgi:hypothetical protein